MKHCKHCPMCTHLASALDRVTAENARLVQACEALLANRDAEALAERRRIAAWVNNQGLLEDTYDLAKAIRKGKHMEEQ